MSKIISSCEECNKNNVEINLVEESLDGWKIHKRLCNECKSKGEINESYN